MAKEVYTEAFQEAMDTVVRYGEEHGPDAMKSKFFEMMQQIGDYERIQNLYKIKNKEGLIIQFKLNKPQEYFMQHKLLRNLILKSRQLGFSTLQIVRELDRALFIPGSQCSMMADKMGRVSKLFEIVKRSYKHFQRDWSEFYPDIESKKDRDSSTKLSWTKIDSFVEVLYDAKGYTNTILHVSEAAFVGLERFSESAQSVSELNEITLESSPNGRDATFYTLWKASEVGLSPFKRFFFEWYNYYPEHPELIDIPDGFDPSDEELELKAKYNEITDKHLIWRRYKIVECGSVEEFERQYPTDSEQCFLLGEAQVFPGHWLKYIDNNIKVCGFRGRLKANPKLHFEESSNGFLKVWAKPQMGEDYVIGADPAEGVGGDAAAVVVIHSTTGIVVATINSNELDPDVLGIELYKLGKYYNYAFLNVECNNHGFAVLSKLKELNYPNLYFREEFDKLKNKRTKRLGFRSTKDTKTMAVDKLRAAIRDRDFLVYDKEILDQLVNYVENPKSGRLEGMDNSHDDLVTACYLAWFIVATSANITKVSKKDKSLAPWDLQDDNSGPNTDGFTGHSIR